MFRDFLSNNSGSLTMISILIGGWLLVYFFNTDQTEKQLNHHKVGNIYILNEESLYAPMRLDSISDSKLFMRNYLFQFSDAVPERNQILDYEFDLDFYAIYDTTEMRRLYNEGGLVKIY